jgi:hypothetical protein
MSDIHFDRREIPKADGFQLGSCGDPGCGPHILALDKEGKPVCELVLSRRNARQMIEALEKMLGPMA